MVMVVTPSVAPEAQPSAAEETVDPEAQPSSTGGKDLKIDTSSFVMVNVSDPVKVSLTDYEVRPMPDGLRIDAVRVRARIISPLHLFADDLFDKGDGGTDPSQLSTFPPLPALCLEPF